MEHGDHCSCGFCYILVPPSQLISILIFPSGQTFLASPHTPPYLLSGFSFTGLLVYCGRKCLENIFLMVQSGSLRRKHVGLSMTVPCPEYYKGWLLLGQTRRIDLCLAPAQLHIHVLHPYILLSFLLLHIYQSPSS